MYIFWKLLKPIIQVLPANQYQDFRRFILKGAIFFGYSNSENRMDKKIVRLFEGKKRGIFIEVGAYDGVDCSNTYLLEKKYKWVGLLIEPVKEKFNLCKKIRTNSIVENSLLSSKDENGTYKNISISGLESTISDDLDENLMPKFHLKNKNILRKEKVVVSSIDYLLEKNNIKSVDIFILDTEGYELKVLEGYSGKVPISYLLVETFDPEKVMSYCLNRSWIFIEKWSDRDYLFKLEAYE